MGHYAIGALVLLAGGFGLAYVATDGFDFDRDRTDQAAISAPANDDRTSADPASKPALQGSAARRMEDFGSGPSGEAVTVPLRQRYDQAYTGGSAGGGGGRLEKGASDKPSLETAALPSGEGEQPQPGFRVIEREIDIKDEAAPGAGGAKGDVVSPSFDVVRVDPSGGMVLAGRAEPLAEVEIKVGDKVIDRITATATGEWVSTPAEALTSGDQELSLTAKAKDGAPVDSRQIVVVSIPEIADEPQADQAVAVVLDKEQGGEGRVLQAPDKLQSDDGDGRLALKLVDYDEKGAIKLSGEAPPGVPVRIYIDNEPAALVIGDSKGYWITTLDKDLPGGDYTLRLDQLDLKGQTVARLETPFTRVTTPPVEGDAKVDYVIVQPGNSLWRIARRLSGDGFNYVYIFEANQGQIKDPDVIYPGQVFEVPADVDLSQIPPGSG